MLKHGISSKIEIGGEAFVVRAARIEDRLDAIAILDVTLVRDGELPKPASLLSADATFSVGSVDPGGAVRDFQGIVTRAERRVDHDGRPTLSVRIQPKLFRLTLRSDVRTFQKKTAPDILKEVIEGAGAGPVKMQIVESHETRDFVVQYRETDFDFMTRLAAEAGIAFTFDHQSGEVVLSDDPAGIADAAEATVKYIPEFGFDQGFTSVGKLEMVHRVTSDKAMLRHYDPKRPRFKLESSKEGKDDGAHALEVYAYPGRTVDDAGLERRTQVLLDALQSRRHVVTGSTTAWALAPGQRFQIEEHPYAPLDQKLLAVGTILDYRESQSSFEVDEGGISLVFEAMPTDDCAYRPARKPPAQHAPGVQTAVTTGAPGQEIDVDADGCVTVLYPWDRVAKKDDTSSVRMRTLQLGLGGSMLLPRVGWEVLVQCNEADPDLPLIVGRLYNAEKPPPYPLPAGKARSSIQTATTPGGGSTNELRTDDSAGSEEMFFNASKDMTVMAKNNATETVGANATLTVSGNQDIDITNSLDTSIGASQSLTVGGNQKAAIETFRVDQAGGDHSLDVGGNRDMKIGGDHKLTVAADETIDVGGMKTDLVVGTSDEQVAGNMSLDVSAVRATLTVGSHKVTVGGNHDESSGAAKVSLAFGAIGSDVGGNQDLKAAAAGVHLVTGDRSESAGSMYTEVAVGAHIVKADNIVFTADAAITLVMGASILSITPASVAILGISVKLDGDVADEAALVLDN
jgi:type VI secretion system secreted protein VgrG